jgi:bacillithiol system protein YtxJ
MEQFEDVIRASDKKPVAILKHSTRCGVSRMVKNALRNNWTIDNDSLDLYYLDLLAFRSVSNAIAELTGVEHESPQVLLFKDGEVVFHASHHAISVDAIAAALNR